MGRRHLKENSNRKLFFNFITYVVSHINRGFLPLWGKHVVRRNPLSISGERALSNGFTLRYPSLSILRDRRRSKGLATSKRKFKSETIF